MCSHWCWNFSHLMPPTHLCLASLFPFISNLTKHSLQSPLRTFFQIRVRPSKMPSVGTSLFMLNLCLLLKCLQIVSSLDHPLCCPCPLTSLVVFSVCFVCFFFFFESPIPLQPLTLRMEKGYKDTRDFASTALRKSYPEMQNQWWDVRSWSHRQHVLPVKIIFPFSTAHSKCPSVISVQQD